MATTFKKLNLPLPLDIHRALFVETRKMGIPATQLVKRLLVEWLEDRRRVERREQVRQFAETYAGTDLDLDPVLEAAGIESLRRLPEYPDEPR